jgi:hypothetical protein
MKILKPVSLLVFLLLVFSAFKAGGPVMTFTEMKHNFGAVMQGDQLEYDFEFTNTGSAPLILYEAKVQCHCTTVDLPEKPVPPGQKGKIHLKFDSKSAEGRQDRTIILSSNADNTPVTLSFKCNVHKKKE